MKLKTQSNYTAKITEPSYFITKKKPIIKSKPTSNRNEESVIPRRVFFEHRLDDNIKLPLVNEGECNYSCLPSQTFLKPSIKITPYLKTT